MSADPGTPAPAVLVVDDSLTVRMDLADALAAAGFEPVPCATAAQARAALASRELALVVLDVILPDGDGVELLREIRSSRTPALPVMMLTSEAEIASRIKGLQNGADEYVGKPYDQAYIVSRARELVRARARADVVPGQRTVLVIDDSTSVREQLRVALSAEGFDVAVAASGEEGLRMAADLRPAAMLVDGQLPGIDGATVIRRVRLDAALRATPCIVLTASNERGAELRALDAGADAFVRKDEDVSLILARLTATLRSAAGRAPGASPGSASSSLLGPKRILAVDDSATYLHELSSALRGEGYDVVQVRSGEEAIELLAVQPVDCILLDLLMPGLSGHETCRRIKAAPGLRDIPLILLTAQEQPSAMLEGLSAGADDYIAKSSDLEVLRARVRAQLRRRQFEDENRRFRDQILRMELEAQETRSARELAETRSTLVKELERKNKELEAFSYSVSHDLRAPLRAIDGFSKIILDDHSANLDDEGRAHLRRVRAATARMGELIEDLLKLSRVGRAELRRQRVDVSAIGRAVAAELERATPRPGLLLQIQDNLSAEADPGLLRAALENLLGNAWKFTGQRPDPVIELGAGLGGAGPGGGHPSEPTFFVRDNGVGFDPSFAQKLFSPFQRLHTEREFPGTGIGLATVYRILDRHGGRVWADAAVGRGATFFFTLPPGR